jgi:phosphomevalonate kinase
VIVAKAPGKLVALGEYAVLDGAPAVVLAVDRYAVATIDALEGEQCELTTMFPKPVVHRFSLAAPAGVGLVDLVTRTGGARRAWRATLDSRAFFEGSEKLGLGSSAAALCAFAGAFAEWAGLHAPSLPNLIDLHRAFQGGRGSGLDVAASFTGGAVSFRLLASGMPQVGSVALPNSVGFAGIFAGRSASTPALVAHYQAWRQARPREAVAVTGHLASLAEAGCEAAARGDAAQWVEAFAGYGEALRSLGEAMGATIVTAEHRQIGEYARRYGVAYKVSGAGGGDLGLACALDGDALAAFTNSVSNRGFRVIGVSLAGRGLAVERDVSGTAQ